MPTILATQLSPLLIPVFALSLWFSVAALVSWVGGWAALARTYRAPAPFAGVTWTWQSARMRWSMNYNNVLTLGVNSQGLFLDIMLLFRFHHPSLLIPWSDIKVRRSKVWFFESVILVLGHELEIPLRLRPGLAASLRDSAGASWPVEET